MSGTAIAIREVGKNFGTFTALKRVSFEIADNEFFTLLGPSGCGKTTLLRLIAGFEQASAGAILLHGEDIAALPPDKRPVNTVFQNYALFPHMNVVENIAFGLEMLGWPRPEIAARTAETIAMVKLEAFAERRPGQLSGGQQQRVALARAMAPRPRVLLLDEPLSALDLKLRQEMRAELKALQRGSGITFIFVTHDQEEALSMSDRIAVMSAGAVQQIGTAVEIYEHPANRFVADFIGETNLLACEVVDHADGQLVCRLADGERLHARGPADPGLADIAARGWLSIRPERLHLMPEAIGECLAGRLESRVYLGTDTQYAVRLSEALSLRVRMQNSAAGRFEVGDAVFVRVDAGAAHFLAD